MSDPTHYPFPSLSAAGWADDPQTKLSKLLALFQVSEHSQSNYFTVASLPYCITSAGSDMNKLKILVSAALTQLLNCGYFDMTAIDVRVEMQRDEKDNPTGLYNLIYDIKVVQDDITYSAGRVVEMSGNEISQIKDLINM